MIKTLIKLFIDKLLVLIFTVFSVTIINKYEFGVDYSVLLPFVKKIINPELYPSDYFIEQIKFYPTLLWYIVGYLCKITHIKLEIFLIILYFISIYFFFLGFYMLAKFISKKDEVAILSLFILLFSKQSFALIETIPTSFYNRTPVLPILIFSIYHFFKKNYYLSYFLLGIGILIHPMSAFYVSCMIILASLLRIRDIGLRKYLVSFLIFILISSPIFILRIINHVNLFFFPDKGWLELLRLRSSHHIFPFSWDKSLFIQGLLFIIGFFITWFKRPDIELHKNVIIFTTVILFFCLIGTIFTEIIPITVVLSLQLFRSYIYMIFIGLIYASHFFVNTFSTGKNYLGKLEALIVMFLVLFNGKYWEIGFFIILFLGFLIFIFSMIKKIKFSLNITSLTILLSLIIVSFYSLTFNAKKQEDFLNKEWKDIQQWAKENTDLNDVFIVPPHLSGFRIYSERSIYTDWKDGTMLNFNPEFGYEWIRRMKNLGFVNKEYIVRDYNRLNERDFVRISEDIFGWKSNPKEVYVIVNRGKNYSFLEVYKNNLFKLYKIVK